MMTIATIRISNAMKHAIVTMGSRDATGTSVTGCRSFTSTAAANVDEVTKPFMTFMQAPPTSGSAMAAHAADCGWNGRANATPAARRHRTSCRSTRRGSFANHVWRVRGSRAAHTYLRCSATSSAAFALRSRAGMRRPDFPSYHSRAASDGSKGLAVATVISTTGWVAAMAPMTSM